MITPLSRFAGLLVCCAGFAFTASSVLAEVGTRSPPVPVVTPQPAYPAELKAEGIEGSATVEFVVTETGEVSGVRVTAADHPLFGEAALAAVEKWKFRPGSRDGIAVSQKVSIPIRFTLPPEDKFNRAFGREVFCYLEVEPIPAAALGVNPQPKQPIRAPYPQSLRGSGEQADVEVEFVITPEGLVVNPNPVGEVKRDFALPAVLAVARAEFDPVLKDGVPVHVLARTTVRLREPPRVQQQAQGGQQGRGRSERGERRGGEAGGGGGPRGGGGDDY
jgi:TonB family protein